MPDKKCPKCHMGTIKPRLDPEKGFVFGCNWCNYSEEIPETIKIEPTQTREQEPKKKAICGRCKKLKTIYLIDDKGTTLCKRCAEVKNDTL